ncbi:hypothetical protein CA606_18105 [Caulobacter vibrioides]|uniref:Uncharacterized protein n=1 Tax=Caulobacter vibrioides TaxID=155892 RepID=A0A290MYL7_CAUVI|nr:hypothetical protein CA606_18105 [Caulobacter vibrioides]
MSEREAAVERVLSDLRALLNGRADTVCPCGRGEKYRIAQGDVLAKALAQVHEARSFAEAAVQNADRTLGALEELSGLARAALMAPPQ